MDPNAALEDARRLAANIIDGVMAGGLTPDDMASVGEDLAEAFQGLDEWLSRGGFKPDAWR